MATSKLINLRAQLLQIIENILCRPFEVENGCRSGAFIIEAGSLDAVIILILVGWLRIDWSIVYRDHGKGILQRRAYAGDATLVQYHVQQGGFG